MNVVSVIIFILFIQLLFGMFLIMRKDIVPRGYMYAPTFWVIHTLLVMFGDFMNIPRIELWQAGLWLHAAVSGISLLSIRLYKEIVGVS